MRWKDRRSEENRYCSLGHKRNQELGIRGELPCAVDRHDKREASLQELHSDIERDYFLQFLDFLAPIGRLQKVWNRGADRIHARVPNWAIGHRQVLKVWARVQDVEVVHWTRGGIDEPCHHERFFRDLSIVLWKLELIAMQWKALQRSEPWQVQCVQS